MRGWTKKNTQNENTFCHEEEEEDNSSDGKDDDSAREKSSDKSDNEETPAVTPGSTDVIVVGSAHCDTDQ